ncbi:MAG: hypothetical protein M3342_03650 [Bacteroidota bacterium]|nr:hypothetical protein [Flavisolibacter sp.]MDQ3843094.1 hypothetical protein [Bacteroidota bacterium]
MDAQMEIKKVRGQQVFFESDEERNYRAVVDPEHVESSRVDVVQLKIIIWAVASKQTCEKNFK